MENEKEIQAFHRRRRRGEAGKSMQKSYCRSMEWNRDLSYPISLRFGRHHGNHVVWSLESIA